MAKSLEQKLCARSFGYSCLRNLLVRPALFLYYKKVHVAGAKEVPDTGPVIFAPNHQNALMDALAVLCTKDRQPVFVARADIFQKPLVISLLNYFRILPIYRKRDGGSSSDNNQETFDIIPKVLQQNYAVGFMPEGTHSELKRLRMLQKGVFRLAMQAQEKHGSSPMVKIVPVGLEYTDNSVFRGDALIIYGKPIEASDFYDLYAANPAKAFKQMQDRLMAKMRELMIDITSEKYYSEIDFLRVMHQDAAVLRLGLKRGNAEHQLLAQQTTIAALQRHEQSQPDEMEALCANVRKYLSIIQKHQLDDWTIARHPFCKAETLGRCLLLALGSPLWLLGMIFNYLPYMASNAATRKVKDPQFVSSVQYVVAMLIFPLFYIIALALMLAFIPCIWGKIVMPLLMIPSGLFAWEFFLSAKKLFARFRMLFTRCGDNPEVQEAIRLRKVIVEKLTEVVK